MTDSFSQPGFPQSQFSQAHFSQTCTQDVQSRRVHFIAAGPIDSARMVDQQIAFLRSIEAPWLMDRIVDLRACTGNVGYEDLVRLSLYWSSIEAKAPRPIKVAVITTEAEQPGRRRTINLLFQNQAFACFADWADAVQWLETADAVASPDQACAA